MNTSNCSVLFLSSKSDFNIGHYGSARNIACRLSSSAIPHYTIFSVSARKLIGTLHQLSRINSINSHECDFGDGAVARDTLL